MKVNKIFSRYNENSEFLANLKTTKLEKIKSTILGYLISLIIVGSPAIILCHFFIYIEYFNLIVFLLSLFALTFVLLGEIFNHKLLISYSNCEVIPSLKITYIVDFVIYFILCMIICIVIILIF